MPEGKGTYGSQLGRPPKKKKDAGPDDFSKGGRVAKAEGSSLLGQEQRTVDKRLQATMQDEFDYITKYGTDYFNSGTAESSPLGFGLFSGAAQS